MALLQRVPPSRPTPEGTLTGTAVLAERMGALMRPSLNILGDELTGRIVDEAKRVLAEVGMEIRGPSMRQRLLDHGLPLDAKGERVLFPRDVVEAAIASAPSSFTLFDRDGLPHADLGGDRDCGRTDPAVDLGEGAAVTASGAFHQFFVGRG